MKEQLRKTTTTRKTRSQLIHQYYTYTGFYSFVITSVKKALPSIIIAIVALLIIGYFVDFKAILINITQTQSPITIFSVFFASESFLGLIPPEIFIAWCKQTTSPLGNLALLSLFSYLGGCVSYGLGRIVLFIPSVHEYFEVKMEKHIKNARKWGGVLIVVGALLPLPFSIASMAAGLIKYNFGHYLLFGLFRFPRYVIYAIPIFLIF